MVDVRVANTEGVENTHTDIVENDASLEVQVDDGVLEIQTEEEVLTTISNIEKGGALELRPIDEEEMTKIDHFIKQTCGCKNNNGGPCSDVLASKFSLLRAQCAEVDKTSLDYEN